MMRGPGWWVGLLAAVLVLGACRDDEGEGCGDGPACAAGSQCTGGRCVRPCRADTDCTGDQTCDVTLGECQAAGGACASDTDCAGRHCLLPDARCVDCTAAQDCPGGVPCDATAHVCLVPCTDSDGSEPNDTVATAAPLAPGSSRTGTLCPADVDFLQVTLAAPGELQVVMTVEGAAGGPRLDLVDVGGGTLASGTLTGLELRLSAPGLAAGAHLLRLSTTGSSPTPYTLTATVSGTAACTQEAGEPNDTPAQATTLSADGAAHGGALCAGDVDHYAITAAAGDRLRVVAAGQGGTTVDLELLDPAGTSLGTGSPLQTGALTAGRYVARVSSGTTPRNYTIAVGITQGAPPCRQVDAEPNDTPEQAQAVPTDGTQVDGAVCPGDRDRFRVVAQAGDELVASTLMVPGSGDGPLVLALEDASGNEESTSTGPLQVSSLAVGTHFVVVQGANAGAQAAYRLAVTLTTPQAPADPCLDNGREPNNTTAVATPLVLGGTVSARLCADDEDRYRFTLVAPAVVRVGIAFTHANGDLDLQVLGPGDVVEASSTGVTNEEVAEAGLPAGDHVVRVYGYRGATNPYVLTTAVASCAGDDQLEENDRPDRATAVGPGSYALVRCPGDDDHLAVALAAGDALQATLTGPGLALELLDPGGALVTSGSPLSAAGLPAGRYVVRVTGTNAVNTDYALVLGVTPGDARVCVDDAAEEDDALALAREVGPASLADGRAWVTGVACAGDEDWVTVPLAGPSRITADLVFNAPADDLDLYLRERQGYGTQTRALASSNGTTTHEHVEGTVPGGTTVALQVRRYGGTDAPTWRLEVGAQPLQVPDGGCVDDLPDTVVTAGPDGGVPGGRDDTFSTATWLSSDGDTASARAVCAGNVDWYQVWLSSGQVLTVDLSYTWSTGHDLDLKVYKPSDAAQAVAFGVSSDDDEHVQYTATEAGAHRVEVYGFSGASNTYSLRVGVTGN
ncbi:MAG: PPC domain-containing protein [Deltaproteobacteria bacterium]|nr:PPC domain-containing protein [Deltaproteobacteria bacterium]